MEKKKEIDHKEPKQKPEIKNPSLKERIEILKEKNEFDKDPMKENIEKPELPKLPEDLPEVEPDDQK